jgi:nondiscriminating aspartyl-tRNA synthetase
MKATRTLVRELSNHIDQTATVQGWLHKRRLLGGLNFIVVRDRTGIVQILVEDKAEVEKRADCKLAQFFKYQAV